MKPYDPEIARQTSEAGGSWPVIQPLESEAPDYLTHEALHMASFLMDAVARELSRHQAVARNTEWAALAEKAHDALFDLYQSIGARHL